MGRYFGIPTPFIDSIILMASSLVGTDFMKTGRTNENVALPIEILEGGRISIRLGRAFPGPESSLVRILSLIQADLQNGWILVSGRPRRVDMIKRGIFASTYAAPTRSILHEYIYFKEKEKREVEIITVKKGEVLREVLGLKTLEKRLFGIVLDEATDGGDFRVQPLLSYGEFKSDVSMHIKKLRGELQEITRDVTSTRS